MLSWTPQEKIGFHAFWLARLDDHSEVTDEDVEDLLSHKDWQDVVPHIVGLLASRMLLSPGQVDTLLARLPGFVSWGNSVFDHLKALKLLRDPHTPGLEKLRELLALGADWAALLAIDEIGPYHCGAGIRCVNESGRPTDRKRLLCQALAAHRNSMWAEIEPLR